MVLSNIVSAFTKVFGSRNDRMVKSYRRRVERINALEPEMRRLSDPELRARTAELRTRVRRQGDIAAVLPEALAAAREVMDRAVGIRNIFNPAHKFDAGQLPGDLRAVYERTAAQAAEMPGAEVLGCPQAEAVHHLWNRVPGWMQVPVPVELYEAVRKLHPLSRPPFRARPFDVQLIGGMVLAEGRIAEMKTGEGKTIVAPLACYLACLEGLQCHVVTVNDYLVQRDRDWVFPFYYWLDLTVGAIHPYHMQSNEEKQKAYQCEVVYGTNSEFGFDYLRDNMKMSVQEQVQRRREFVIVDEVDSILIDEARTPLIISGPAHEDVPRYELADQIARHLMQKQREWNAADDKLQQTTVRVKGLEGDIRNSRDKDAIPGMREEMRRLQLQLPELEEARDRHTQYFELEREKKQAHLTHDGIAEAQKLANIGSFYVGNNMDFPHLLENALRAHAVYQRDRDYVVQGDEVIIVDEFTGRLMIGRQWSDGLHQAVEAKERVKIKQETQTLATVTIQNFFKLYRRRAGMTGTASTEATEFYSIYKLDVVQIPTNVAVVRKDHNDLIFISQKDKWNAIVDEIKRLHDVGRPVLVGTTSVENSEMLSQLLTKKHGIKHEVLNAKQHEREAQIVLHAGELGAVMIATNMAGRGTDIKLAAVERADLVRHWQVRNLLPSEARAEMADEELLRLSHRHQARMALGLSAKDAAALGDDEARLRLLRHWAAESGVVDPDKARSLAASEAEKHLDRIAEFMLHRLRIFTHTDEMGGLHIVGTERHEARRIDNQLRGRSGRQGDQGASRFFISLEDDLMKLFAGKKTLMLLSKFGMKEGDAIEHSMITRSVERAQRKVEERNYEIRKNLLEYDEVMEHQRSTFYGLRQEVLEGRSIQRIIFDYLSDSVDDAVRVYLEREYVPTQIAEWCRANLDAVIDTFKLRDTDPAALKEAVMTAARDEVTQTVALTLGEYMSHEAPPEEWDLRGLSSWAMSRFKVDLKQNQLRQMTIDQVQEKLLAAALEQLQRKDLSGLDKYLVPNYAHGQLAEWANQKFGMALKAEELAALMPEQVAPHILARAREAYLEREVAYPVEFMLQMVFQAAQQDSKWASEQLAQWARQRYGLEWTPEEVTKMTGQQLHEALVAAAREWLAGGRVEKAVDEGLPACQGDPAAVSRWLVERFGAVADAADLEEAPDLRAAAIEQARGAMRLELTQLERFVLLQILDMSWKDHLYAMDQLKDAVGLRGYAEKDPRIEYKREGANHFRMMQQVVRDRVTDLIFRARLSPNVQLRSVYNAQQAEHAEAVSALSARASQDQQEDQAAAERAGSGEAGPMSRKQRRAAAAGAGRDKEPAERHRPQIKERKRRR